MSALQFDTCGVVACVIGLECDLGVLISGRIVVTREIAESGDLTNVRLDTDVLSDRRDD